MGQQDRDDDATDVVERAGYSDVGMGPPVDTSSFDMTTPAGAERRADENLAPESMRVSNRKRAEAPKMLARNKLAHTAAPPPAGGNRKRMLLIAGVALGVLILLVAGGAFMMAQTNPPSPEPVVPPVPAASAPVVPAPPPKPKKVEGVRVRDGLQRAPDPTKTEADVINVVPSGGRIEDAPPTTPSKPGSNPDAEGTPGASD